MAFEWYETKEFKEILRIEEDYYVDLNARQDLLGHHPLMPGKVFISDVDKFKEFDKRCQENFTKFSSDIALFVHKNIGNPGYPTLQEVYTYFKTRELTEPTKRTTIIAKTINVNVPFVKYYMGENKECKYQIWIIVALNDDARNKLVFRDTGYNWTNETDRNLNFERLANTGLATLTKNDLTDDERHLMVSQLQKVK